ncbi:MAG: molybdopterin molybdotransferase MoeA [Geminicoccaceae bacterium]
MTTAVPFVPRKSFSPGSTSDDTLLSLDAAIRHALDLAEPVEAKELVPLESAIGRALADGVDATMDLPPFDAAAMDGYAIKVDALRGEGPWTLPTAERVLAGEKPGMIADGAAVRIMTGAPVPAGFDTVVMQERVTRNDRSITITDRPKVGLNIRLRGEDARPGDRLLGPGREIGARELAALSAIGRTTVSVRRRLKVALICTGSELIQPGTPLGDGQIYNSNRYALLADLSKPWIDLDDYGALPDDAAQLETALTEASLSADVVITTGGMSVGDADYLPGLFEKLGGCSAAIKVAMKPGKPLAVGRLSEAIYLGLPGNPVSVFTTFALIGSRTLRRRAGFSDSLPIRVQGKVNFRLKRRPGRIEFRPASIIGYAAEATPILSIAEAGFSARISALAAADGFAVFPPDLTDLAPGEFCDFIPFTPLVAPR